MNLMQMKASGKPAEVQTAQILEALSGLQAEVREIKRTVSRPVLSSSPSGFDGSWITIPRPTYVTYDSARTTPKSPNVKSTEDDSK